MLKTIPHLSDFWWSLDPLSSEHPAAHIFWDCPFFYFFLRASHKNKAGYGEKRTKVKGGSCQNKILEVGAKLLSPSSGVTSNRTGIHWWGRSLHTVHTCTRTQSRTFIHTPAGRLPAVDLTDWYCSALNGPTSYPYRPPLNLFEWVDEEKLRVTAAGLQMTFIKDYAVWNFFSSFSFKHVWIIIVIPLFYRIISQIWLPTTALTSSACQRRCTPTGLWWWSSATPLLMARKTQRRSMPTTFRMLHSTCE